MPSRLPPTLDTLYIAYVRRRFPKRGPAAFFVWDQAVAIPPAFRHHWAMIDPKGQLQHPMDVALGARLRALREAKGITQKTISMEIGVASQQYSKYEMGRNPIYYSRLTEIARALGVTVVEIISPLEEAGNQSAE